MRRSVIIAVVAGLLGLTGAGYVSYTGTGLVHSGKAGEESSRTGSVSGPGVMGGGPNSGK
ncbi:MAG: hypothetical protein U0Q19_04850 [Kineosporiaceae bacterium]